MADKREFQARHEERSFPSSQLPPEAAATKATSDSFTEDASNFRAVAAILVNAAERGIGGSVSPFFAWAFRYIPLNFSAHGFTRLHTGLNFMIG